MAVSVMLSIISNGCLRIAPLIAGVSLPALLVITVARPSVAQVIGQGTVQRTAPIVSDEAYTLGAGDRVRVEVFKLTQYSGENQVLVDGTLNLAEVGSVSVQGMTLREASEMVSKTYAKLLRYSIATVTLVAPRPVRVGVSGEVNRAGSYTLPTTEGGSQLPTITRALQQAGGVTQLANLRNVEVRRVRRGGAVETINVNLWEFLQTGDLSRDITLRGGDSIFIPSVSTINLAESVQISSASFAADRSQPLNIAVVGEVYRPGLYTVTASTRTGAAGETGQQSGGSGDRSPTITRAIQVAGGIKPQADIRNIQVRRLARTGVEQTITINLWELLQKGEVNQDLILQDRDTIVIPIAPTMSAAEATQVAAASFSPDTIRVNVVGEVKQPGVVKVPPNTPLNQALLAAGGLNVRARKRSVDLIRLNSNGTVTKRRIDLDLDRGLDEHTNPALRNDDVVVVDRSGLTVFSDNLGSVLSPINGFLSVFSIFRIFAR